MLCWFVCLSFLLWPMCICTDQSEIRLHIHCHMWVWYLWIAHILLYGYLTIVYTKRLFFTICTIVRPRPTKWDTSRTDRANDLKIVYASEFVTAIVVVFFRFDTPNSNKWMKSKIIPNTQTRGRRHRAKNESSSSSSFERCPHSRTCVFKSVWMLARHQFLRIIFLWNKKIIETLAGNIHCGVWIHTLDCKAGKHGVKSIFLSFYFFE